MKFELEDARLEFQFIEDDEFDNCYEIGLLLYNVPLHCGVFEFTLELRINYSEMQSLREGKVTLDILNDIYCDIVFSADKNIYLPYKKLNEKDKSMIIDTLNRLFPALYVDEVILN